MKKHLDIRVFGLVQGVWFRKHTREQARALGANGFVRNEPDGSVFIEAEGEEDALNALIGWCEHGPEQARVEKVEVVEGQWKEYGTFNIQH